MASLEMKDVHISNIRPFEKIDHALTMEASLIDLCFLDFYVPTIFFYKSKKQSNAGVLIAKMKESLSKTLVHFFPFAGRWVRTYDSRARELQRTNEGVPFIEASVDVELDSVLHMGSFEPNSQLAGFQFLGLDPLAAHQGVDAPLPAVFIQATKFKCGGVSLNVTICHMSADGFGMMKFMKAWSDFASSGETSITPNHDRSLILPREAFMKFLEAEGGYTPPKDDSDSNAEIGNPKPKAYSESKTSAGAEIATSDGIPRTDPGEALKLQSIVPLQSIIRHVKRKTIEDLKHKAAEENINITTVDLISAHLWQSVSSLVEPEDQTSILSISCDGRRRFHNPPLPQDFIGNAVANAITPPIPVKELASQPLSSAAKIVHNAVASVNSTTWKFCLLNAAKIFSLTDVPFAHLALSSWFRFPTYEISFGCGFDHPVFACMNFSSGFFPLGIAFIAPPPPSCSEDTIASVQVCISTEKNLVKALEADEKFNSLFHESKLQL